MLATVAVKEALVSPVPTMTLLGTVMLALLENKATTEPPAGAAEVNETVQVDVPGAFTVAGEQPRLLGCEVTVKVMAADWFTPLSEPLTVTFPAVVTVPVVAAKVALD
jgi:hypothetical protein